MRWARMLKVFNAGLWAARASWGREQTLSSAFRTLATHLLPDHRQGIIYELVHLLRLDAIDLHSILADQNIEDGRFLTRTAWNSISFRRCGWR